MAGIPVDRASLDYTILYEFTTLTEEASPHALQTNVFRPDVARAEVIGFKRRIGSTIEGLSVRHEGKRSLRNRKARLTDRKRQLLCEIERIDRPIHEIDAQLRSRGS